MCPYPTRSDTYPPQGNYILLGRRKGSGTGTGWVIKVDPTKIVPGQPCPYTVLISELQQPWAGLGACIFVMCTRLSSASTDDR